MIQIGIRKVVAAAMKWSWDPYSTANGIVNPVTTKLAGGSCHHDNNLKVL